MTTKQTPRDTSQSRTQGQSRAEPGFRDRATDAIEGARERAIEAYDSARESAAAARAKTREGIGEAPLIALGGGLAVGAILAALLPRTRTEDKLLGPVAGRVTGSARAAVDAAKEAGREKLTELNLTRDSGTDAVQSLFKGLSEAAKTSGEAALGAVRKKN